MELPLLTNEPLQRYNEALGCLKQAVANVVPTGTKVSSRILNPKNEDPLKGFGLGLNGKTRTMSAVKMGRIPNSQRTVETALQHFFYDTKPEPKKAKKKILYFDIETHSADVRWDMPPDKFFRLGQWAWGVNGKVEMTTSYEKMIELVREADLVVGHNIHSFDLSVLFGKDSIEPLEMALDGKVFDTMVHANLVLPAPYSFQMRDGSVVTNGGLPRNAMRWLGLDNLSYQLGTQGKIGDLRALAKKHGGFGAIPLDDPEFLEYAEQDIVALQELSWRLLCIGGLYEYEEREQLNAAIDAQNSRNGWLVDVVTAESRRDELAKRKKELLKQLQEDYGFPVEGKAPWATLEGKAAILKILKDFGIDPYSIKGWARTATGNISLGGKEIVKHTTDTPAQELGQMLAELKGQRSLSQLALDSIKNDGRVHPDISALQRSGRKCIPTTHKILTKRGVLSYSEVRKGDYTLDERNNWVKILDVFLYRNERTVKKSHSTYSLEGTENHRWVKESESGVRSVGTVREGERTNIIVAPHSYVHDLGTPRYPDMTPEEKEVALLGFLLTDGRVDVRSDRNIKAHIYQTKPEIKRLIEDTFPEYIESVYIHPSNGGSTYKIDPGKITQVLKSRGLYGKGVLRHREDLLEFVLGLTLRESEVMFLSAWFADGNISILKSQNGGASISCGNPCFQTALQVLAYRSGFRNYFRSYDQSETQKKKTVLRLSGKKISNRSLKYKEGFSDVWCVQTETGTFTAWNGEKGYEGPYLTGNSFWNPGLTIWTARGQGAVEKSYFIADPNHKLVELDFSNADARIVAAYSGDKKYAERFKPGMDGHEINGRIAFRDMYDTDPVKFRNLSKPLGHGYSYGAGARKLAGITGVPLEWAESFVNGMDKAFPDVVRWKKRTYWQGERDGFVVNDWGRVIPVEKSQAYTQAPAMYGQSGTRELMVDALIRMARYDIRLILWLVAQVHDALVFNIPEKELDWAVPKIKGLMQTSWKPRNGGQEIFFSVDSGNPADNWEEAGH